MKLIKKSLLLYSTFIICFINLSCENETLNNNPNEKTTVIKGLEKLSHSNIIDLKLKIVTAYKNEILMVDKIKSTRKIGSFDIITFNDNMGIEREIGFENLINKNGQFNNKTRATVYCTGTCNCHLEGELGDDGQTYVQCSCSDCKMHYQKNNTDFINQSSKLEDIASSSFKNTFDRKPIELKITKVTFEKHAKANIMTVFYSDKKSEESTFLVISNYDYNTNKLNYNIQKSIDYIVDCFGSCDCRERFHPENGSIECTCNTCKMKITPVG